MFQPDQERWCVWRVRRVVSERCKPGSYCWPGEKVGVWVPAIGTTTNLWFINIIDSFPHYHRKPVSGLKKGEVGITHIPQALPSHGGKSVADDSEQGTRWVACLNSTQWNIRGGQCPALGQWKGQPQLLLLFWTRYFFVVEGCPLH